MSDASLPHCEKCEQPEYACMCSDLLQARMQNLMSDLLETIREYSDKNERPDEIFFVLDQITEAYREAFRNIDLAYNTSDSATDQRVQRPERPCGNGAKLPN